MSDKYYITGKDEDKMSNVAKNLGILREALKEGHDNIVVRVVLKSLAREIIAGQYPTLKNTFSEEDSGELI